MVWTAYLKGDVMKHLKKVSATALGCIALATVGFASPAVADETGNPLTMEVVFTGGVGVLHRDTPTVNGGTDLRAIPEGKVLKDAACQTTGEEMTNDYGFTSDNWVYSPSDGYISDAFIFTGQDTPGVSGLPRCDDAADAAQDVYDATHDTRTVADEMREGADLVTRISDDRSRARTYYSRKATKELYETRSQWSNTRDTLKSVASNLTCSTAGALLDPVTSKLPVIGDMAVGISCGALMDHWMGGSPDLSYHALATAAQNNACLEDRSQRSDNNHLFETETTTMTADENYCA